MTWWGLGGEKKYIFRLKNKRFCHHKHTCRWYVPMLTNVQMWSLNCGLVAFLPGCQSVNCHLWTWMSTNIQVMWTWDDMYYSIVKMIRLRCANLNASVHRNVKPTVCSGDWAVCLMLLCCVQVPVWQSADWLQLSVPASVPGWQTAVWGWGVQVPAG